jgi:hypothetical protein
MASSTDARREPIHDRGQVFAVVPRLQTLVCNHGGSSVVRPSPPASTGIASIFDGCSRAPMLLIFGPDGKAHGARDQVHLHRIQISATLLTRGI